jgi:hypothetical protein
MLEPKELSCKRDRVETTRGETTRPVVSTWVVSSMPAPVLCMRNRTCAGDSALRHLRPTQRSLAHVGSDGIRPQRFRRWAIDTVRPRSRRFHPHEDYSPTRRACLFCRRGETCHRHVSTLLGWRQAIGGSRKGAWKRKPKAHAKTQRRKEEQ